MVVVVASFKFGLDKCFQIWTQVAPLPFSLLSPNQNKAASRWAISQPHRRLHPPPSLPLPYGPWPQSHSSAWPPWLTNVGSGTPTTTPPNQQIRSLLGRGCSISSSSPAFPNFPPSFPSSSSTFFLCASVPVSRAQAGGAAALAGGGQQS